MEKYDLFLGGEWVKPAYVADISSPFDQSLVGKAGFADQSHIEKALSLAVSARKEMAAMPSAERSFILKQLAESVKKEKTALAHIVAMEAAKPWKYALAEVERGIQTIEIAAEEALRWPGDFLSLDRTPAGFQKEGWLKHVPAGIVIGIAPFNFPLNLALHKLAPAIAAGCPIILKPASATPLSMLWIAQKLSTSNILPKGAVSILPCDRALGQMLVEDPRAHILSFTGSDEVGWALKKAAGKKKTILELGGNAAVWIAPEFEMDQIIDRLAEGSFAYQGQVCIHTQRIYVPHHKVKWLADALAAQIPHWKYGSPVDPDIRFSAMINAQQALRVKTWVQEALDLGAKLHGDLVQSGSRMMPAILTQTHENMRVNSEELFGPVVCIHGYDEPQHAFNAINAGRFGLQAGVFTDRISLLNQAFSEIEAGGIIHNDIPGFRVDQMPYGGVKDSGMGREGVRYAMVDYLEPKLLVKSNLP